MEIIEKSNLKTKALVIILIATVMLGICAFFSTVKAAEEPKLNTKIEFTGKTYKYPNQDKVRKEYADGERGCGIVSIISKKAKHTVYVTGEGWIDADQIVNVEKYITLDFKNLKKEGLKLTVNGEFVNVQSTNTAVLEYGEDGSLAIKGNGITNLVITTKKGEKINALATVVNGSLALNVPNKAIIGELSATATIADKITIEAKTPEGENSPRVGLIIDENGIGIEGKASGTITVKAEGKEIGALEGSVNGKITANKEGITAEGEGSQTMTLLQKLTFKLSERANATINKDQVDGSVGGAVAVNDKEVASGDAGLSYNYGDEDPKADLRAEILGKEVIKMEDQTVPVVSMLKKLISRIKAR